MPRPAPNTVVKDSHKRAKLSPSHESLGESSAHASSSEKEISGDVKVKTLIPEIPTQQLQENQKFAEESRNLPLQDQFSKTEKLKEIAPKPDAPIPLLPKNPELTKQPATGKVESIIAKPNTAFTGIVQSPQQTQLMHVQHAQKPQGQPGEIQPQTTTTLPYQQIYHPAVAAAVAASAFFKGQSNAKPPGTQPSFPPTFTAQEQISTASQEHTAQATTQSSPNNTLFLSNTNNPSLAQRAAAPPGYNLMYQKQPFSMQSPVFNAHPTATSSFVHQSSTTFPPPQTQFISSAYGQLPDSINLSHQRHTSAYTSPTLQLQAQRPPATSNSEQLNQMLQQAKASDSVPTLPVPHLATATSSTQQPAPDNSQISTQAKILLPTYSQSKDPATASTTDSLPPLINYTSATSTAQPASSHTLATQQFGFPLTSSSSIAHPTFATTTSATGQNISSLQSSALPPPSMPTQDQDEQQQRPQSPTSDNRTEDNDQNRKSSDAAGDVDFKKQKAREKNRIHSRNSRLRKKDSIMKMKEDNTFLQMFKVITEAMADMVSVHDLSDEARLVYANPSFVAKYVIPDTTQYPGLQHFQRQPNVRVPSTFLQLVHEDDAKTLIECLRLVRYDTTQAPILSVRILTSSAPAGQDGSRLYAMFQSRIQASSSVGTLIIVTRPLGSDNECFQCTPKNFSQAFVGGEVIIAPTGFVV